MWTAEAAGTLLCPIPNWAGKLNPSTTPDQQAHHAGFAVHPYKDMA
jgi:hypothetical protein